MNFEKNENSLTFEHNYYTGSIIEKYFGITVKQNHMQDFLDVLLCKLSSIIKLQLINDNSEWVQKYFYFNEGIFSYVPIALINLDVKTFKDDDLFLKVLEEIKIKNHHFLDTVSFYDDNKRAVISNFILNTFNSRIHVPLLTEDEHENIIDGISNFTIKTNHYRHETLDSDYWNHIEASNLIKNEYNRNFDLEHPLKVCKPYFKNIKVEDINSENIYPEILADFNEKIFEHTKSFMNVSFENLESDMLVFYQSDLYDSMFDHSYKTLSFNRKTNEVILSVATRQGGFGNKDVVLFTIKESYEELMNFESIDIIIPNSSIGHEGEFKEMDVRIQYSSIVSLLLVLRRIDVIKNIDFEERVLKFLKSRIEDKIYE